MTTRYSYLSSANNLFLRGVDIATCDVEAVNEAAVEGEINMMRHLTLQGINIYTYEALVYAAMYGHLEAVKFLTKMSNAFKIRDRNHALAMAAKGNHLTTVRFLQSKCYQNMGVALILAIDVNFPQVPPLGVVEYFLDSYGDEIPPIHSEKILTCIKEHKTNWKKVRSFVLSHWRSNVTNLIAYYL